MDRMAVKKRLEQLICSETNIGPQDLSAGASFLEDLGLDELQLVELIMAVETHFHIQIPDETAERLTTFGVLIDYLERSDAR